MRPRLRYDQEFWLIVTFILYLMFLAAVWPFWFPVVDVGERG